MTFHDFGPYRASKIMPPRRGFVTVDFYSKSPARIKKARPQSTLKHQNHLKTTGKQRKVTHLKIIKINTANDPPK